MQSLLICGREPINRGRHTVCVTIPRVILLSRGIPLVGTMSGKPSALPDNQRVPADVVAFPRRVGYDGTDGLVVTNAGSDKPSSEALERPAPARGLASEREQSSKEHSGRDPAVSVYEEVFSKAAMEGPGKSVSKVEAHADKVGKFEGKGPNVGKSERSTGKVEDLGKTVGKSEEDTVGKVEQTGKSVPNSDGTHVGKTTHSTKDESVGKSVGKAENQSVGQLGKQSQTGKVETGKVEAKVEADVGVGTGKSLGKAAEGDVGKASDESVGRTEQADVKTPSQRIPGHEVGIVGGNIQQQTLDSKEFVIAVAGKSDSEMSYVDSLTWAGEFKLPEGATLVAYEQAAPTEDGFRVGIYMDQLMTRQFGRLLFYARELPSTHTLLSQNCKTLPVGTLSVADFQFQGKGRAGNSWESPKGCLMFSFTLQMSDGRAVPFLQYVASLAIVEAIESHCLSKGLKPPEVRIKWPNDLYAKGLKVGGVLCTSTYSSKQFNIVVGVGLNVGNRQPTTCLDALLEEINEGTPRLSKDELLAAIISKFENLFDTFSSQGFYALETDYYKRWLHSDQTIVLEERQEGNSEVSHVPLRIQGLTPSGYLRAVDDASEAYELHPDGNSLDFLKGLMRKKM